jgi:hypothetical protein
MWLVEQHDPRRHRARQGEISGWPQPAAGRPLVTDMPVVNSDFAPIERGSR